MIKKTEVDIHEEKEVAMVVAPEVDTRDNTMKVATQVVNTKRTTILMRVTKVATETSNTMKSNTRMSKMILGTEVEEVSEEEVAVVVEAIEAEAMAATKLSK